MVNLRTAKFCFYKLRDSEAVSTLVKRSCKIHTEKTVVIFWNSDYISIWVWIKTSLDSAIPLIFAFLGVGLLAFSNSAIFQKNFVCLKIGVSSKNCLNMKSSGWREMSSWNNWSIQWKSAIEIPFSFKSSFSTNFPVSWALLGFPWHFLLLELGQASRPSEISLPHHFFNTGFTPR